MLEDMQPPIRIASCAVRKIREGLNETDQAILDKAIADENIWPSKTLASALTGKGLPITDKPIRKHRNAECSCTVGLDNA